MKVLYKHQQEFLARNKDRDLLVWEGGTGKTLAGCEWIKLRKGKKALVVCPKSIVSKWKKDLKTEGAVADVITRDEIKRTDISKYKVLVLDEAHDFASPLFDKSRSQRATKVYTHLKDNPNTHVLLLTATPIRSTAWNIHTLACYLGIVWNVRKFRDEFFYMTNIFGRYHWEPKADWRVRVRKYLEEIADIKLMSECADIPPQHHQVINVPWTPEQEKALSTSFQDSSSEWHTRHRAENGKEKLEVLKGITDQYRKVIVVCHYTSQIGIYASEIGKDRQVFVLQGNTKDQGKVIADACASDDCVFIVQASMGAGFDGDAFSVIVFASMSFKYIDYAQMKFRVKRLHNLHENTFIYLLGGKCDENVYKTIQAGKNFDPIEYLSRI